MANGEPISRWEARRRDVFGPFLAALDGTPTPRTELVEGGRRIAEVLVEHRRPVILCGDDRWAGVWDLERLTDDEAIAWGLWVTSRLRWREKP